VHSQKKVQRAQYPSVDLFLNRYEKDLPMKNYSETIPGPQYVCPRCHVGLNIPSNDSPISCGSCKVDYPVYRGIPDFRLRNPHSSLNEIEKERLETLLKNYDHMNFQDLLRLGYSFSKGRMPEELRDFQLKHELRYKEKGKGRRFKIDHTLTMEGKSLGKKEWFLDIGCGSGTTLPWVCEGFAHGVGIDISIVDLVVGKKFLEENNIHNIWLACGYAECLPFSNEMFDLINATDVIEHVMGGQGKFLEEAKRVLRSGGVFYFNSPNRYNIFGPEPHVQVWFVGFLPRKFMDRYVWFVRGAHYKSVRLLSYLELSGMVKKLFPKTFWIGGPFLDPYSPNNTLKTRIVKTFPFILKILNAVLFPFTTNYQVVAHKLFEDRIECKNSLKP